MYRKLNIIIALMLLAASCVAEKKEYIYENSGYRVILTEQCKKLVGVELINLQNNSTYFGIPDLCVWDDDGSPIEGGLEQDYNNYIDDIPEGEQIEYLYHCDSIYSIETDSIHLGFGQESYAMREHLTLENIQLPNRRLSLGIYNSKLPDFIDGNYTLYFVNPDSIL